MTMTMRQSQSLCRFTELKFHWLSHLEGCEICPPRLSHLSVTEWWTVAVLHPGIIGQSNPPGPTWTLSTECRAGRQWNLSAWFELGIKPTTYPSQGGTLSLDHWAGASVLCLPPESVPWLRETDLDPTGMEWHREPDREVASSVVTPAQVTSTESNYMKVIFEPHCDDFFPRLLRETVLGIACQMNDEEALAQASNLFDRWINGTDRYHLPTIYSHAVQFTTIHPPSLVNGWMWGLKKALWSTKKVLV